MISKKLTERYKAFFEGDIVQRIELVKSLKTLSSELSSTHPKMSSFLDQLWPYMDSLSVQKPIAPIFHRLGEFLEVYGGLKKLKTKEERQLFIKERSDELRRFTRGESPIENSRPVEPLAPLSSSGLHSSFTEKEEDALNLDAMVLDSMMVDTYKGEVLEFLDSAQSALLDLEHDSGNDESINKVFAVFILLKAPRPFWALKT